ncbi:MAG: hypothetical protein QOI10_1768 [Solirubrobacterales bacterium]|jgi:uncharacterized membrane protein YkoI|nr:hypothetical protein [Solirubrobacterales bacterium]
MNEKIKGVLVAIAAVAALAVGGAAIAGATGGGGSSQQPAAEAPESSEPAGQSDANESESGNDPADAADSEGANDGADSGAQDSGDHQPITGSALDKASAVALKETGGGKVTDSEAGDEQGYYEVEVTRADGSQVDVHLDSGFNVINSESDGGGGE